MADREYHPRIAYDVGPTIITLTYPHDPPDYATNTVGGSRIATSGAGAGFRKRIDNLALFTLRYAEAERMTVRTWLLWGMFPHRTQLFRFDDADATTEYTTYLDSPKLGERYEERRSVDYPDLYELPLILRAKNSVHANGFDVRLFT